MRALETRLWRELWRHRGQMLSIAALVAVGIMTVLTMRGTYESLVSSRDQYYASTGFPDVWAQVSRAPESVCSRIEAIDGVARVQTRIRTSAKVDVPGLDIPAFGELISVDPAHPGEIAQLHLTAGRALTSEDRYAVIVGKKFAQANGYVPGDTLDVILNGRFRQLAIVGMAISPEYTYTVPPGSLYPDDQRYGVLWMSRQTLGPVFDLDGAFNDVVLTLDRRADPEAVLARLDQILEPYGGQGAYLRKDQPSHAILQSELDGNRTTGTAIPAVFLLIAAFLLNIVLGRMVATQRTEIAVLKAFGYTPQEIGLHYLRFASVAILAGALVGVALGLVLGRSMVELYAEFFDFPTLQYGLSVGLVLLALGVSGLAAVAGALSAVRRAMALPPAEAMRPEPPQSFEAGVLERIGLGAALSSASRMVLRNMERRPIRAVLSSLGVAFSAAILVVGLFMFDGVTWMMDLQFRVAQREDLSIIFNKPLSESSRFDLGHQDGVTRVETFRSVPVRLRNGHLRDRTAIMGLSPDGQLRRLVSSEGRIMPIPASGLAMSKFLADRLGVSAGDLIRVEVQEGARRVASVRVALVLDDFMGTSAYMSQEALNELAGGPRVVSGAFLRVDADNRSALNEEMKLMPAVASVASPAQLYAAFDKQMSEGLFISLFFILSFSGIIAVSVIYNGARISLSERGRELASLRVLGFSRGEVATLLLGEQAITTLVGIPMGWLLGYLLAAAISTGMQSEAYRIPFVVDPATFGWSALATLAAAIGSGWIVRRRLDRMNLIEVLKTRD